MAIFLGAVPPKVLESGELFFMSMFIIHIYILGDLFK